MAGCGVLEIFYLRSTFGAGDRARFQKPATASSQNVVCNPYRQLSKLLTILTFLLLSCSTSDKYDIFKIDSFDKYEFLDFKDTDDIKTFNEKFWKADSADNDFSFVAKFDFEKGDFSEDSDKGIRLEGLPYQCLTHDCSHRNALRLYFSDTYEILNNEMEDLNEKQIKELIKTNILNYGKDPTLSGNPQEAITDLFFNLDQKISKSGQIIKMIADSYVELIENKRTETNLTKEQLMKEFPLTIYLRHKIYSSDLTPVINQEEINELIVLDSLDIK